MDAAETTNDLHTRARAYIEAGLPVIPLNGKLPRTRSGSKDGTTDPAKVDRWFEWWPSADIGICTGHPIPDQQNGYLVVIDIDPGGLPAFMDKVKELGKLPDTWRVRTGRGGAHLYLRSPVALNNKQGWVEGVDIRGTGGFVVAPPSVHENGNAYSTVVGGPDQIGVMPEAWVDALRKKRTLAAVVGASTEKIPAGQRHEVLIREVGALLDRGVSESEARAMMLVMNSERFDPPEDEAEIVKQIADCYRRWNATQSVIPTPAIPDDEKWESSDGGEANETVPAQAREDKVRTPSKLEARIALEDLEAKLKADPGYVFQPDVLAALIICEETDQASYARAQAVMRKCKVRVRQIEGALRVHRQKLREAAGLEATVELGDTPIVLTMPEGWRVREEGVYWTGGEEGPERVLPVPLYITRRLRTVTEGEEKLELSYKRDGEWHSVVADRSIATFANQIGKLADHGLPVTSNNAAKTVRFLEALEAVNLNRIPREDCTTQAGWIGSSHFYPGAQGSVSFTPPLWSAIGEAAFAQAGSLDAWKDAMVPLMRDYPLVRLSISASLAAPLVKLVGHRSFVLHLWGNSGGGKSASMLAALSAWGNPHRLVGNFNTTAVGLEHRMEVLGGGIPVGLNERQVADKKLDQLVYMAGEGQGRTRGAKGGGLRPMSTWHTILLTNGEEPLVSAYAAQGARTRTLEFEGEPITVEDDARAVYECLLDNYGHAGKLFVQRLIATDDARETVQKMHRRYLEVLRAVSPLGIVSHLSALALIASADKLMQEWLEVDLPSGAEWLGGLADQVPVLDTDGEATREYEVVMDLVNANRGKFHVAFEDRASDPAWEMWGVLSGNVAYVYPTIFDREIERLGLRPRALRKRLDAIKKLLTTGNGEGRIVRAVKKNNVRYVAVKMPEYID